jgi:hypothetical protein
MITNKREQSICDKYSHYDETGRVRCKQCPLVKGNWNQHDFRCKANSHYDRHTGEWEFDDEYKARCE